MSGNKHDPVQATELGTVIKVNFSAAARFTRTIWNTILIVFWAASLIFDTNWVHSFRVGKLISRKFKSNPAIVGIRFFDFDI